LSLWCKSLIKNDIILSRFQINGLIIQTLISAFFNFSSFAIGFLRVYYFSKNLTIEDFGVLSLLLTISAFLMYVFTFGSYQFLFKKVSEGSEEIRMTLGTSIFVTLTVSFFFIAGYILFSNEISEYLNLESQKKELLLILTGTATTSIMMQLLFYHYGLRRNNFQNLLQFMRGSLWVIISIVFSLFLKLTLFNVLIIFNISIALILLISLPWGEWESILPFTISKDSLRCLMSYCIPLLPYFAGVWGIPLIVRAQLNILNGAKDVAIFSVAYTMMEMVFMFISNITATISPYFFEKKFLSEQSKLYNVMLKYSVIATISIVPFVFMLRKDVILMVASEDYLVAAEYMPLLILFPLLRVIIVVFEQQFLKSSKTTYLGIVYVVGMLISFLVAMALIPVYSVYGAIISSLTSYFFIFVCLAIGQEKIIDFRYLGLINLFKLLILNCSALVVLELIDFSNFIKIIPLSLITISGLLFLPILDHDEKSKILNILKIRK
jgi:O-antigen/teichoic acid export membrane protein